MDRGNPAHLTAFVAVVDRLSSAHLEYALRFPVRSR
jgi:hypothetical protein